jgi:hypothetical protein
LIVTAAVAATVATIVPAPTHAVAMAPCQAKDVVKLMEYSHTVAVTGAYTASGAIDVQLTCGIVQNGVTVQRFSEAAPGPVAAIATTTSVSGQFYSVCYDLSVTYVDRSTFNRTCP